MNALVGVRKHLTGQLSPSMAERSQVESKLLETSNALSGVVSRDETSGTSSVGSSSTPTQSSRSVGDQLDKDAFLQLLVLQMQNQAL